MTPLCEAWGLGARCWSCMVLRLRCRGTGGWQAEQSWLLDTSACADSFPESPGHESYGVGSSCQSRGMAGPSDVGGPYLKASPCCSLQKVLRSLRGGLGATPGGWPNAIECASWGWHLLHALGVACELVRPTCVPFYAAKRLFRGPLAAGRLCSCSGAHALTALGLGQGRRGSTQAMLAPTPWGRPVPCNCLTASSAACQLFTRQHRPEHTQK